MEQGKSTAFSLLHSLGLDALLPEYAVSPRGLRSFGCSFAAFVLAAAAAAAAALELPLVLQLRSCSHLSFFRLSRLQDISCRVMLIHLARFPVPAMDNCANQALLTRVSFMPPKLTRWRTETG